MHHNFSIFVASIPFLVYTLKLIRRNLSPCLVLTRSCHPLLFIIIRSHAFLKLLQTKAALCAFIPYIRRLLDIIIKNIFVRTFNRSLQTSFDVKMIAMAYQSFGVFGTKNPTTHANKLLGRILHRNSRPSYGLKGTLGKTLLSLSLSLSKP